MHDLPQSFDLQNSRDLLGKLERELDRLKAASVRQDIADHAYNFAVTAWHMCDWVARDIHNARKTDPQSGEPLVQPRVHDLGIRTGMGQGKMKGLLQEHARDHCPDLRLCETFANASKHSEPLRRPADAEAVMAWSPPRIVIVLGGGTQLDGITTFEAIAEFWFRFVHDRQIA